MMAVYTQLHKSDIREIAGRYNLTVIDYEPIAAGAANSNYIVRTQQGYLVLTVFEEKVFSEAVELGQLLLLLKAHAFPTTRPLFAANGEMAINHKGKPVMVKEYMEGQVYQYLDKTMLYQVGITMARLHYMPWPDFLTNNPPYGLEKFSIIKGQNIDTTYEAWITRRLSYFEKEKPHGVPRGLVHGDLFYDNVLFEGKKLKAIIDFEVAIYEGKVFDLGMGIVGLCRSGSAVLLEKAQALVKGYEQIRRLEEEERSALQLFVEYAAATVSCWRYWKYHVDAPDVEKRHKHLEMMRVAEGVREIPKASFTKAVFS
jgi:homoserine kinase type II